MPLTPAEVHNVAFKKPPIGKRGYDEEEVDAFLDVVEVELSRLIEENNELNAQSGNGRTAAAPVDISKGDTAQDDPHTDGRLDEALAESAAAREENQRLQMHVSELEKALSQGKHGAQQQVVQLQQELTQVRQQLEAAQREAVEARQAADLDAQGSQATIEGDQSKAPVSAQAIELLALAQETADKHLANAQQEAERLLAEAQANSSSAISAAQEQAHQHLSAAEARATQLDEQSSARATRAVQEAEERVAAITGQLEQHKATLERRVEELGAFEREYRSRLKSYLESQLRDLDVHGVADPIQNADPAGSPRD